MAKVYVALTDTVAAWLTKHNDLVNNIGDLVNLNTTQDSDLVGAINEIHGDLSTIQSQITNNDNDITSLQSQITSNDNDITSLQSQIDGNDYDITVLQDYMNGYTAMSGVGILDNSVFVNEIDTSKEVRLNLSFISSGNTLLWSFPDNDGTFVGEGTPQTLTNKKYSALEFPR